MKVDIKFAKVRPDAIIPSKREEDVGFDLFACFDEDYIKINPGETQLIPIGIASSCNNKYGFIIKERSSTGSKGIAVRAGVIDSSYRGEWKVAITNTTNKVLFISKLDAIHTYQQAFDLFVPNSFVHPYSKAIAQAVVIPVPEVKVEEISYEELQKIPSERGTDGFGSTDK